MQYSSHQINDRYARDISLHKCDSIVSASQSQLEQRIWMKMELDHILLHNLISDHDFEYCQAACCFCSITARYVLMSFFATASDVVYNLISICTAPLFQSICRNTFSTPVFFIDTNVCPISRQKIVASQSGFNAIIYLIYLFSKNVENSLCSIN